MRDGTYRKTEAGRDEIQARSRRLLPALRTVLLMVDGQRTLAELKDVAHGVRAPEDVFEQLLELGLIEAPAQVRKGFDPAGLVQAVGASVEKRASPTPWGSGAPAAERESEGS